MTEHTTRRLADGSIDFSHYRAEANRLQQEAKIRAGLSLWQLLLSGIAYFKLPQNRWMRRQASSRSSVLVA